MKRIAILFGLLLSIGLSSLALAITLDEAKAQGLIGEKVDGFVAAIESSPNAEVRELVTSTNNGRRQVYADLAKRNNITVEQVGILSAEKLRGSAASGTFLQQPSGQWQRKP